MTRRKPDVRALKPNERERLQRQALIDALLDRALRGLLTIPEAAVLAEAWRAERRVEEKTRRQLTDTTRALARHREAADAEIRRLEGLLPDTAATGPQTPLCGPQSASEAVAGAPGVRGGANASRSRTAPRGRSGGAVDASAGRETPRDAANGRQRPAA